MSRHESRLEFFFWISDGPQFVLLPNLDEPDRPNLLFGRGEPNGEQDEVRESRRPHFASSGTGAHGLSEDGFVDLDEPVHGPNHGGGGGGGGAVIWRRDMQRWMPMPSSLGTRVQSARATGPDYVAGAAPAADTDDGGLVDEEKIATDWIGAADMSSDEQDYDLRFPVLQSLLSEKRVDVKKPGPHFDRQVSSFTSPDRPFVHLSLMPHAS